MAFGQKRIMVSSDLGKAGEGRKGAADIKAEADSREVQDHMIELNHSSVTEDL
jgi:hypothetical protein